MRTTLMRCVRQGKVGTCAQTPRWASLPLCSDFTKRGFKHDLGFSAPKGIFVVLIRTDAGVRGERMYGIIIPSSQPVSHITARVSGQSPPRDFFFAVYCTSLRRCLFAPSSASKYCISRAKPSKQEHSIPPPSSPPSHLHQKPPQDPPNQINHALAPTPPSSQRPSPTP